MINAILCLMGPGGIGKLTIGRLVAERLGCRLVDNHYWLNPIFGLIEQDGVTPRRPTRGRSLRNDYTISIDLAKSSVQVHGVNAPWDGRAGQAQQLTS